MSANDIIAMIVIGAMVGALLVTVKDGFIEKFRLWLKPKKCPKCKAKNVLKIEYGEFSPEFYNAPGLYFAGCCVEDYEWHCGKCRWEWGKNIEGRYCEDDVDDDDEVIKGADTFDAKY